MVKVSGICLATFLSVAAFEVLQSIARKINADAEYQEIVNLERAGLVKTPSNKS